jgi:hypothetical protein
MVMAGGGRVRVRVRGIVRVRGSWGLGHDRGGRDAHKGGMFRACFVFESQRGILKVISTIGEGREEDMAIATGRQRDGKNLWCVFFFREHFSGIEGSFEGIMEGAEARSLAGGPNPSCMALHYLTSSRQ